MLSVLPWYTCLDMDPLKLKIKTDQIPTQAHRLYIQLYCERKEDKKRETVTEAKKSWVSLSLTKKKLFYKTTANRNLVNYAHGLSKTKIYLKERLPKVHNKELCSPQHSNAELQQEAVASIEESHSTENGSHPNENELVNNKTDTCSPPDSSNHTELEDTSETQEIHIERHLNDLNPPNQMDERQDAFEARSSPRHSHTAAAQLTEPTPPNVKIGKDLYEMIKQPGSLEWKDLHRKDKSHYHTAVRAIKREYIKNYTKYLESLSRHQLFDHYMKTLH